MGQFFYVREQVRFIREPDDLPMDDDEWQDDLRMALIDVGYKSLLLKRQAE